MVKVGVRVWWESRIRNTVFQKCGVVIAEVAPGQNPLVAFRMAQRVEARKHYAIRFDPSAIREETSYLVVMDGKKDGQPILYWPRVKKLAVVG